MSITSAFAPATSESEGKMSKKKKGKSEVLDLPTETKKVEPRRDLDEKKTEESSNWRLRLLQKKR